MICSGLKRNYCVTSVNLSWNGFGQSSEGRLALCELIRGSRFLRELDVSHNGINWEGAALVAKGLKENDTLEVLLIGGNPLTMTGVLDILEAVDNPSSAITYIGFDEIPVNRRIVYAMEILQKNRSFSTSYGCLLDGEDVLGRRNILRCDPLKLLIQFFADKDIRPYDLFREYDKEKQYQVTKEEFVHCLKKAKVPLDQFEMEKVQSRLDFCSKEGKLSYQRLVRGVKDQIRIGRMEDQQKLVSANSEADDYEKTTKAGLQHVSAASINSTSSHRGTPSPTGDRPNSASSSSSVGTSTTLTKSSIGRSAGEGTASKVSCTSQASSRANPPTYKGGRH